MIEPHNTTSKNIRGARFWYIVIWITVIVILSLLPKNAIDSGGIKLFKGADKAVHFFMYFVFMYLWGYAAIDIRKEKRKRFIIAGVVYGALLGIILEFLQKYLDLGRNFDIFDIIANLTGLFFVFLINKNLKDEF